MAALVVVEGPNRGAIHARLVARAVHRNSARRRGPFVALNGAVLRGDLLERTAGGQLFKGQVDRRGDGVLALTFSGP